MINKSFSALLPKKKHSCFYNRSAKIKISNELHTKDAKSLKNYFTTTFVFTSSTKVFAGLNEGIL